MLRNIEEWLLGLWCRLMHVDSLKSLDQLDMGQDVNEYWCDKCRRLRWK